MEGVSIIETKVLEELIESISTFRDEVLEALCELREAKKNYLNIKEVIELTGLSLSTIHKHKSTIGFSKPGGVLTFKRKDVDEFMEVNYLKRKVNKA